MLTIAIIFAVVMVLPIKLAAHFCDGERTGILVCAVASLVAPLLAVLAFRLLGGGFAGFALAYATLVVAYVGFLQVPVSRLFSFAVVVLALQIGSVFALISLGHNVVRMLLANV